jgi:HEAT repeat protein
MLAEFARMLRDDVLEPTDPIVEECVGHVATESWATPVRRAGRAANDFPAVRARAARLLGDVGTPAAHAILYSILRHDTDNTVRGEAALAIARIAVVDRQPTIDLFAYLLSSMATTARPDNAFTYALVRAVRIMIDTSGPIADPDLYTAMVAVAQGPYSGTIRDMAVDTLVSMRESSTN